MIFYVAEHLLRYFISERTVHGNEHGLGEGTTHETLHQLEVIPDERTQVTGLGAETEGDCQFKEES